MGNKVMNFGEPSTKPVETADLFDHPGHNGPPPSWNRVKWTAP